MHRNIIIDIEAANNIFYARTYIYFHGDVFNNLRIVSLLIALNSCALFHRLISRFLEHTTFFSSFATNAILNNFSVAPFLQIMFIIKTIIDTYQMWIINISAY